MNGKKTAITPTREENFSEWYHEVVKAAELAENGPVRGSMVIKPWGYGIWENIQRLLDIRFKKLGHKNVYFPLFIPLRLLEKEAQHVEGFAKECAVVTHTRLEVGKDGGLVPAGPLEEPLIVRPTSETVIGEVMSKWVESFRDLPILINQWCNIVRWEMRTRMFLRTTEILWQEGHTAHSTQEEAMNHAKKMLDVYVEFSRDCLAIPTLPGRKTTGEKFPGAEETFTFEMLMPDGKALQGGTSHFLGQNFSKAAGIRFQTADEGLDYAYTTSWGVTTRLVGALIMTHSDDDGLVLPPRVAPTHIVILPVLPKAGLEKEVFEYCDQLADRLREKVYYGRAIEVEVDKREMRGGEKKWHWVKKGAPLRVEIGPRDMEKQSAFVARRDESKACPMSCDDLVEKAAHILDEIQNGLLEKATDFVNRSITDVDSKEALYQFFEKKSAAIARCFMKDSPEMEDKLKEDLQVTCRCIPLDAKEGLCIFSGEKASQVLIARAY